MHIYIMTILKKIYTIINLKNPLIAIEFYFNSDIINLTESN